MKTPIALFVLAGALAMLPTGPTAAQRSGHFKTLPNGPVSQKQFEINTKANVYSYQIQEFTRDERLACGGDRFVVRWKANAQASDQRFVFHPLANGKFRIESQGPAVEGRKWLGIADGLYDGRLLAWTKVDNNTQEFTIEWNADDTFSLKEPTKGEYVSVSPNGNVVRWSRHTDPVKRAKEQTFKLFAYRWHAFLPAR